MILLGTETTTTTKSTTTESSAAITTGPNNGGIPGIAIRTVYVVSEPSS